MLGLLSDVSEAKVGLTPDFINGFETGIFVRDDENAYYDYSCDKPKSDSNMSKKAQTMIGPMKLATSFMNDKAMNQMVSTVEIFINSATELEAVFRGGYDGGDFCSGFIFGRSGSKMLMEIAGEYLSPELPDDHNPALKPPKPEKGKKG